jgi:hypothetical protein
MMRCQVETYSGSRLHERPRRFTWEGQWLEVRRILARGREPDSLYFKIAATDDRIYVLKYYHLQDAWEANLAHHQG